MTPETKTALLAAAGDIETAIRLMGLASDKYAEALETAIGEASKDERGIIGTTYGADPLVQAIRQSMGAHGLTLVLRGRPERDALTAGNVEEIMASRLAGF